MMMVMMRRMALRLGLAVLLNWKEVTCGIQWADLRENLQHQAASGNHSFSHEMWDFPAIFHVNQSIEIEICNTNL